MTRKISTYLLASVLCENIHYNTKKSQTISTKTITYQKTRKYLESTETKTNTQPNATPSGIETPIHQY